MDQGIIFLRKLQSTVPTCQRKDVCRQEQVETQDALAQMVEMGGFKVCDSCGLPSERWDVEVGDVHELDVDGEERSTVIGQMEAGDVLQHEEGCADEMDGDECEESTVEIAQLDLWSRGNVVSAGMVWIRCRSTRRRRRHADLAREGRQRLL